MIDFCPTILTWIKRATGTIPDEELSQDNRLQKGLSIMPIIGST
jgi:hypothetical protein